jgi:hypothetical protein
MFTRSSSVLLTAVLAVACVLALAPVGQAEDMSISKPHSAVGCLRNGGAPDTYVLSNRGHGAPRTMSIASFSPGLDLAVHLGQKVQISGTLVPATEAEADPNVPKALTYMNVTAIQTISATCQ